MHIQDTNVLNPGRDYPSTSLVRRSAERGWGGGEGRASATIKTRHFIIFHIDNRVGSATVWWCRSEGGGWRRRRGDGERGKEGRREDNENNGYDGEKAEREGEEGEGLTAINFAKIGAYPVVGRQSNPGSARATPFA